MCDAFRRGRRAGKLRKGRFLNPGFEGYRSFQSIQEEKRNFGHKAKHVKAPRQSWTW